MTLDESQQVFRSPAVQGAYERNFQIPELPAKMAKQIADRHASRLKNRGCPTRHGDVVQVGDAFKSTIIANQHFPTPDIPVCPIACAVKSEADYTPIKMVFRHATGNVRVMVLYPHDLYARLLQRPTRAEIIRMQ